MCMRGTKKLYKKCRSYRFISGIKVRWCHWSCYVFFLFTIFYVILIVQTFAEWPLCLNIRHGHTCKHLYNLSISICRNIRGSVLWLPGGGCIASVSRWLLKGGHQGVGKFWLTCDALIIGKKYWGSFFFIDTRVQIIQVKEGIFSKDVRSR